LGDQHTMNPQHTISDVTSALRPAGLVPALAPGTTYRIKV